MVPKFILPSGYTAREMELSLSRDKRGWKFYGRADGYLVPARNPSGDVLCNGEIFATKQEAAIMARALDLPAYSIWNGRTRRYDGNGFRAMAFARDAKENMA